jgi:mxaC protein
MNFAMSFDAPWLLALLPLALLPLWRQPGAVMANTWLVAQPRDWPSDVLGFALRAAAVLAIAGALVGMAGPHRPEVVVERQGQGAEIVLVIDRSRSMDQSFAGARSAAPTGTGPEALAYYSNLRANEARASKGQVARQMLGEFAQRRPADRFGLVAFSNLPMRVLGFTSKPEIIQAAIQAGNVGRGLSETNIARALQSALAYFEDRPYTGSRIVLLVSDGGDKLDVDARNRITEQARKHRVGITWIYIRSPRSPGLMRNTVVDTPQPDSEADTAPEIFLDRFFQSLQVPYRAYEADDPDSLQRAIADLDRLENLPITYLDTVPRRDLAGWAYGAALAAVAVLLLARRLELPR